VHSADLDKLNMVEPGYGGLVFVLEPIFVVCSAASKTKLVPKVVERDSKIIISIC